MFGWFRPTCPCDPAAKQWVEDRLQWLTRQFGLHILLERPIILPSGVVAILDEACRWMSAIAKVLERRALDFLKECIVVCAESLPARH